MTIDRENIGNDDCKVKSYNLPLCLSMITGALENEQLQCNHNEHSFVIPNKIILCSTFKVNLQL